MTQTAWQSRLTAVVAGQLRRYRRMRRLSAQQVSDRCAELGLEIHRQTLADLENGRRASISVAELVVLAQVLEVPPALLIVPVETQPRLEILPGREASTADVLDWFAGEARFVPKDETGLEAQNDVFWWETIGPAGLVHLYRTHNLLVSMLQSQLVIGELSPGQPVEEFNPGEPVEEGHDSGPGELHLVRRTMRERGVRVPDLPPELAWIDPAEPSLEELRDRIGHAVRRA